MLKSLIRFLIFLAVICGIGILAFNPFLSWLSSRAMNYTVGRLQSPDLTLSNPSFRKAGFSFPKTVTWEDFSMTAMVRPRDDSGRMLKAVLKAERVIFEAREFFNGVFIIDVKGLHVSQEYLSKGAVPAYEDTPEALKEGNAVITLKLNLTGLSGIKMQIREFAAEIKRFSEEARTVIPIQFSAKEILKIRGNLYSVGLRIEKTGETYSVVAEREDLEAIGGKILAKNQVLTAADIEVIANNPLRAPQLLRIKSRASNEAASAFAQNSKVPEHAYRHVLWSYLLAKEYGPDFARKVTEAHEISADALVSRDSGAEAHNKQDLANNETGRKYASLGYAESDILRLVMTDPRIVR